MTPLLLPTDCRNRLVSGDARLGERVPPQEALTII
ncbi:hypothetical protein Rin_00004870 [Candidatus Regiella insecticola 5.15]|uniref:Uncharacterized protein n=1 Tax=Candidatus Regiella insecticola 5.15 TaxID=1005043 RepID=G2GXJ5_9ENTR|nr:hypothetical protein Rin_00004870 [Candidatus Regiella insecticola 5.15]